MPNEQDKAVESAVAAMTADAPSDWVSLHAEFTPVKASATVDTESAEAVRLDISPEALQDIASHQRRAAELGEPWHRLVIDCDRSGPLTVSAVPDEGPMARLRRVMWVLVLVTLLVVAAGAVFVLVTLA
jgi:hypothetical protein